MRLFSYAYDSTKALATYIVQIYIKVRLTTCSANSGTRKKSQALDKPGS